MLAQCGQLSWGARGLSPGEKQSRPLPMAVRQPPTTQMLPNIVAHPLAVASQLLPPWSCEATRGLPGLHAPCPPQKEKREGISPDVSLSSKNALSQGRVNC